MSLASKSQQLSLSLSTGPSGGTGVRSLGNGSVEGGVFDPFLIPSSSLSGSDPFCQLFSKLDQGERSSRRALVSHRERGSRARSSLSGLLQRMLVAWKASGL